jgi:hypothetical protein
VTLSVRAAELQRNYARDDYFAKGLPLVEIALSEAQWATLVSSLNVGQGVPCTLEYAEGKECPGTPRRESGKVHEEEFKERIKELGTRVAETRKAIEEEMGLSKKKKDAAMAHLARLEQDLTQNLPWYTKVLEEHMHKTVESAKVEVSAYVNSVVARAGIKALTEGSPAVLSLPSGQEEP